MRKRDDDDAKFNERQRKLTKISERREKIGERACELARQVTEQVERNERAITKANKTLDGKEQTD